MTEHDQALFREDYGRAVEARQRFDYFLTGLNSAVLAYAVQSHDPGQSQNWVCLAPVSWFFLLLGVGAGLVLHRFSLAVIEATAVINHANSRFDELLAAAKEEWNRLPDPSVKRAEGWASKMFHENESAIAEGEKVRVAATRERDRWDRIRSALFLVGLLTLGIWKSLNL
jgi:hypothetical protein